ncbi:hypothetical protein GBA52_025204 [Prunus armeniaca]|nr:hypothetical protein GBA52_025204 [Prunus armeniaca]
MRNIQIEEFEEEEEKGRVNGEEVGVLDINQGHADEGRWAPWSSLGQPVDERAKTTASIGACQALLITGTIFLMAIIRKRGRLSFLS